MRNIALLIEYDGTAYGGWQIQKNGNSIQGIIEKSLSTMFQENVKAIGAGRTDAGVHAKGQVANFHTSSKWKCEKIQFSGNGLLPVDISIRKATEVPETFHARYDAVLRRYVYRIVTSKTPTERLYTSFVPFTLSVHAMTEATSLILGTNDFRSFTKHASERSPKLHDETFICNVSRASWTMEHQDLTFVIEADRFLYGMVRAIVGALIAVGRGRLSASEFRAIMETGERRNAPMSAPAAGLTLDEVIYAFDLWGR